jgi:ketosteroid isomerase-like protein
MDESIDDAMVTFQRCIERRDRAAAEQVLDDDFALVLVEPIRAVMTRGRWLDVLGEYVVHEYVIDEQVVDVDGDCAAVLHRVRMRATVLGDDRSGVFVLSDMWRRRDGRWRIWRRHSTPLSAGSMPGMKT